MMKYVQRVFFILMLLAALLPAARAVNAGVPSIKAVPPTFTPAAATERWRIRVDNAPDGPIEVSTDLGLHWQLVGRVTNPATRALMGYLAAGYAPVGTVAATAVHGIRIRLGDVSTAYPNMINIIPKEFAATPNYFGGHIAGASGIYTDVPAGVGIFRELAPPVGSKVYLQDGTGHMRQLDTGYTPQIGDILVITALWPTNPLRQVIFENTTGGAVTVTYADGTSQVITHVGRPVQGTGRFDGTSYTGVGAVNTNHTCVITISTAPDSTSPLPEGMGDERRGGFQIEPAYHNTQTEEASAPQVMIVGTFKSHTPSLEGTPPLFYGAIGLAWSPDDLAHSWVCDVETADKPGQWQPMPTLLGNQPQAFVQQKVVAFRLHQDKDMSDTGTLTAWVAKATRSYNAGREELARQGKLLIARGTMPIVPDSAPANSSYLEFYVDGNFAGMTNTQPFTYEWDTTAVADGEHLIEARVIGPNDDVISAVRKLIWVDNAHDIH